MVFQLFILSDYATYAKLIAIQLLFLVCHPASVVLRHDRDSLLSRDFSLLTEEYLMFFCFFINIAVRLFAERQIKLVLFH